MERLQKAIANVSVDADGKVKLTFNTWWDALKNGSIKTKAATEALQNIKDAIALIAEASEKTEEAENRKDKLDETTSAMEDISIEAAAAGEALKLAAEIGISDYGKLNSVLKITSEYIKFISKNAITTQKNISGEDEIPKAHGGVINAAMGQFVPRGTDTVPARLTPGEFVMNKASTQRFMQQLVPMNYSQNMAQYGQPNNSMQFGDINVTVQGGQNNQQTALEIGNSLRREIRRGRLSL